VNAESWIALAAAGGLGLIWLVLRIAEASADIDRMIVAALDRPDGADE
jgi:hypothetical protein